VTLKHILRRTKKVMSADELLYVDKRGYEC